MNFKLALAVATLTGTIVGVGFFSIPYVIFQIGFFPGVFYIIFLAGVLLVLHLLYGEVILRTKEQSRLPGYTKRYLGKSGRILISVSTFIVSPVALICYVIAGGEFISVLSGFDFTVCAFIFWIILSLGICAGVKSISKFELFMLFVFVITLGTIFIVSLPEIELKHFGGFNPEYFFLPYGVILFSVAGTTAIPLIRDILKGQEKDLKKAIILGTILPAVFYIIFTFSVIGISGENITEEAMDGLTNNLGGNVVLLGAIFGIMTVSTSFLTVGTYLRDVLLYDFNTRKWIATASACVVSLLAINLGKGYLIPLMGFIGVILAAFEDVIIILISRVAKMIGNREPEYQIKIPGIILLLLAIVFLGGLTYEIIFFIFK